MSALIERAETVSSSVFNSPNNQLVWVVNAFTRIELVNGRERLFGAGSTPMVKNRALGNRVDALEPGCKAVHPSPYSRCVRITGTR